MTSSATANSPTTSRWSWPARVRHFFPTIQENGQLLNSWDRILCSKPGAHPQPVQLPSCPAHPPEGKRARPARGKLNLQQGDGISAANRGRRRTTLTGRRTWRDREPQLLQPAAQTLARRG